MRIISDFHDYYDCIQRMGQDRSIVYLRRKKVVEGWPFPSCNGFYSPVWIAKPKRKTLLTRTRVIGFCGKIAPLIELFDDPETMTPVMRCWSLDDVDLFMKGRLNAKAWEAYRNPKGSSRWARDYIDNHRRRYFQGFFEDCKQRENNYEHLFRDHHSPLFVATRGRNNQIVFNASLKEVQFYTQFDNYRAFQEIAMYMGGILGTHGGHKTKYKGAPMSSEVSDRDLATAKGFDKHSFRSSK